MSVGPSDESGNGQLPDIIGTDPLVDEVAAGGDQEDASSIHSLPNSLPITPSVQVTPATDHLAPASPATEPSLSPADRRLRHRSAIEPRTSNRLSGFFNHLIHRREPPREEPATSTTTNSEKETNKPPDSPPRSTTPPPMLPPPSLQELGLSLSVVTSDLSPSHFSTPPTSGTFLAPHYLLLCHAQGLDVLPLTSPPASQPYALVRRVSFKSVVVMEQRGVLVAIAGRRDGVRVYALEEVKRAVEWRIEVELKRERDRSRREMVKKIALGTLDGPELSEKPPRKASLSTPPTPDVPRAGLNRKGSSSSVPTSTTTNTHLIPRNPTLRRRAKSPATQRSLPSPLPPIPPSDRPPSYSAEVTEPQQLPPSSVLLDPPRIRPRGSSITNVLGASSNARPIVSTTRSNPDAKADWDQSSDDEAINITANAASGSQALDERTSAQSQTSGTSQVAGSFTPNSTWAAVGANRRTRPANLDLSSISNGQAPPPEPSPVPTLWTLRQALAHSPVDGDPSTDHPETPALEVDGNDEGETADGRISLAQALLESRIPDLPPAGSQRPQQPILIESHPIVTGEEDQNSPRTSESHPVSVPPPTSPEPSQTRSRRRRWSVILGQTIGTTIGADSADRTSTQPPSRPARNPSRLSRTHSHRSGHSARTIQATTSHENLPRSVTTPDSSTIHSSASGRSSRFLPRMLTNAFNRPKDERESKSRVSESDLSRKMSGTNAPSPAPPPKLEYVKLPGTKTALLIKAVETPKKSFLAILCGDNGEKVELFAGTYRTALGLSRTFILPDSPRSLELQLQGDDLVEVFLVFSQNVFGLEPATVRVREVRIGRAERRAARRRAREIRGGETGGTNDSEAAGGEEETNVNVSIGVAVPVDSTGEADGVDAEAGSTLIPAHHPDEPSSTPAPSPNIENTTAAVAHAEELVALATAQMGPYTTFQQLSFAPRFPLASIADDYIIPPTYPDFVSLLGKGDSNRGELTSGSIGTSTNSPLPQFSPPGLPIPPPSLPSKWFYRDPKNVVHGPWKASLMQAWYKDGLLPPDLPVRREGEYEYTLLKDLRQQCIDPSHPFRSPPVVVSASPSMPANDLLLPPISLLSQPKHFGPPALFYSSRGGHSTTIVDARGRSVLKGRFVWSQEDTDGDAKSPPAGRMGDVKRIEAFDVDNRSVLVAMRQGGLEVVDLGDALLKPADASRMIFPQFNPPPSNINRRRPFVWKIGTPVSSSASAATVLTSKKPGLSQHLHAKKQSSGPSKSPLSKTDFGMGDSDSFEDEVLFLGRKEDELYICERNSGFFRILRLGPTTGL